MYPLLVKLSFLTHLTNLCIYSLGDSYWETFVLFSFALVALGVILGWVPIRRDAICPDFHIYFVMPLLFLMFSSKDGIERDFMVKSILSQFILVVMLVAHRHELTVGIPLYQRFKARETGCPGH